MTFNVTIKIQTSNRGIEVKKENTELKLQHFLKNRGEDKLKIRQ